MRIQLLPQPDDTFGSALIKGTKAMTIALGSMAIATAALAGAGIGEGSHYGDPSYGVSSSYGNYNSDHTSFTGPIPQIYQLPPQTLSPQFFNQYGVDPRTHQFNSSPGTGNPGMSGAGNAGHHDSSD